MSNIYKNSKQKINSKKIIGMVEISTNTMKKSIDSPNQDLNNISIGNKLFYQSMTYAD